MITKYKNLLLLHFVVFIWGFTGILGALITIPSENLVWHRMVIALSGMFLFLKISKIPLKISKGDLIRFLLTGLIIALHWITFFEAIKISNVSVTLACLSSATFFTAFLEPLFYKRKIIFYEMILGVVVIVCLYMIFQFESKYQNGILLTLFSALMSSLFTVINGTYAKKHEAGTVAFYEMIGGITGITLFFVATSKFDAGIFQVPAKDWVWLVILGTICTAFALIASIKVMKELTPYTVTMAVNLEPVYGIILALFIFKENELMSNGFYFGTAILIGSIFLNGYLKSKPPKFPSAGKDSF